MIVSFEADTDVTISVITHIQTTLPRSAADRDVVDLLRCYFSVNQKPTDLIFAYTVLMCHILEWASRWWFITYRRIGNV